MLQEVYLNKLVAFTSERKAWMKSKHYRPIGPAYIVGRVCQRPMRGKFASLFGIHCLINVVEHVSVGCVQSGVENYKSLTQLKDNPNWQELVTGDVDGDIDVDDDDDLQVEDDYAEFDPGVLVPVSLEEVKAIQNLRFEPNGEVDAPTDLYQHADGSTNTTPLPHLLDESPTPVSTPSASSPVRRCTAVASKQIHDKKSRKRRRCVVCRWEDRYPTKVTTYCLTHSVCLCREVNKKPPTRWICPQQSWTCWDKFHNFCRRWLSCWSWRGCWHGRVGRDDHDAVSPAAADQAGTAASVDASSDVLVMVAKMLLSVDADEVTKLSLVAWSPRRGVVAAGGDKLAVVAKLQLDEAAKPPLWQGQIDRGGRAAAGRGAQATDKDEFDMVTKPSWPWCTSRCWPS
ncbi:hypothetical protein GQ600_11234 [Phytophthora cactorum]|nr:hypothetical protein GQ600_11234 [Phytophthora cactorum]